jgi:hypothetical protein
LLERKSGREHDDFNFNTSLLLNLGYNLALVITQLKQILLNGNFAQELKRLD